jgi:hypothetical protein
MPKREAISFLTRDDLALALERSVANINQYKYIIKEKNEETLISRYCILTKANLLCQKEQTNVYYFNQIKDVFE